MLTGTAVTTSVFLVTGQVGGLTQPSTPVDRLAYVYGIGGKDDKAGANIPAKLSGQVIKPGDTFVAIGYSADIPIDTSVAEALPVVREAIGGLPAGEKGLVVGYSEGAIVAEYLRRELEKDPGAPAPADLDFLQIAGPTVPNGGIYARFSRGIVPGFTATGPAAPSRFDTTYVTIEYDPIGDFPAYFNPLALANSMAALIHTHPDASYNDATVEPPPPLTKTVHNSGGGSDTYVFLPVEHLQLLQPLRDMSAGAGLAHVTEPLLAAVEPALRVLVDMGYTDRQNLDPEEHVPFSLITPPGKFVEAANDMPEAIRQGFENFRAGVALAGSADDDEADDDEAGRHEPDDDDEADDEVGRRDADHEEETRRPARRGFAQMTDRSAAAEGFNVGDQTQGDADEDAPTQRREDRRTPYSARDRTSDKPTDSAPAQEAA
jgi:hypothetical protein